MGLVSKMAEEGRQRRRSGFWPPPILVYGNLLTLRSGGSNDTCPHTPIHLLTYLLRHSEGLPCTQLVIGLPTL